MKPEKREGEESRGAGKKCEICQDALVVVQLLRPSPEKAGQGHGRRGLTSLLFGFKKMGASENHARAFFFFFFFGSGTDWQLGRPGDSAEERKDWLTNWKGTR